ncbi:family domain protein [Brucella suis 1330]|nr:family domain protein [Brucella suis 1330]
MRIDKTAFNAYAGYDEFTLTGACGCRHCNRLDRLACKPVSEIVAPIDIKTTICGAQPGDLNSLCFKRRDPCGIGTEFWPAGAAKGKKCRVVFYPGRASRCFNEQCAVIKPDPAVAGENLHTLGFQTLQPCAQQGRCLHGLRKHAAGRADKSFCPKIIRPLA